MVSELASIAGLLGGGGDCALDDRRVGELHCAVPRLEDVLDRQYRAAQVGQHDHAVALVGPPDRVAHERLVRPQRAVRIAAGALQADVIARHLARHLDHAPRDLRAVRHDHHSDHLVSSPYWFMTLRASEGYSALSKIVKK